jgi:hypothetical protein
VAQRLEHDAKEQAPTVAASASPREPAKGEGVLLCIDPGFVRSCEGGSRPFKVTVGRCERPGGPGESFGVVADQVAETRWKILLARQGYRPEIPCGPSSLKFSKALRPTKTYT